MRNALACVALLACGLYSTASSFADADLTITQRLPHPEAGGVPWSARDVSRLHHDIDAILSRPALSGAQVGVLAIDTQRHTVLYASNADQEFQPASNFKLVIGSIIAEKLGPSFAFHTHVLDTGTIANGTLNGDLYLQGGGDVRLTAKDVDAAAAAVAAAGITHVSGALVGDASRYDDARFPYGWDWDDLPYYYGAAVSALSLEENVIHAYMTPGNAVGQPVQLRVEPATTAFTIDNTMTTGTKDSKDTSDIVHPWDQPRTLRLTGTYPLGAKESGDLRMPVPSPPEYALDVFAKTLTARGVKVDGTTRMGVVPQTAVPLWSHDSETLPQLLADFWWPSDNLMGETFLKELAATVKGAPGTDDAGRSIEQSWLHDLGVAPYSVDITDGSGLSNYDRITPRAFVQILQHDWDGPNRQMILNALPVAGVVGTLKSSYKGTPAEKNVWAKTGSINHVRTLSGFLRTRRHGAVTISLLVNQWRENAPNASADLAKVRADLLSHIITN